MIALLLTAGMVTLVILSQRPTWMKAIGIVLWGLGFYLWWRVSR